MIHSPERIAHVLSRVLAVLRPVLIGVHVDYGTIIGYSSRYMSEAYIRLPSFGPQRDGCRHIDYKLATVAKVCNATNLLLFPSTLSLWAPKANKSTISH